MEQLIASGTNLWLQICKPGISAELVGRKTVYAAEDIVFHTSLSLAYFVSFIRSPAPAPLPALTFVKTCVIIRNMKKGT